MDAESRNDPENESPLLGPKPSVMVTDESKESLDKGASSYPFKRWMDSFRVKKTHSASLPERFVEGWPEQSSVDCNNNSSLSPYHALQDQQWERLSGHSSQLGTVKTASLSIASQSIARSRGHTQSTTNQSVGSDHRMSLDSPRTSMTFQDDEQARIRAIKRREVLRELYTTESDYVSGLKALSDVLSIFTPTDSDIYSNLQRLREIHGQFLSNLENVSPKSSELVGVNLSNAEAHGLHRRLSTMDIPGIKNLQNRSLRMRSFRASVNARTRALAAEPYEALQVAREIDYLSTLFSAYEPFGNKYDLLKNDLDALRRSIPSWAMFDRGIEALLKSAASMDSRKQDGNKSMTLDDLLIKPVQRLCKYELFLNNLLKNMHATDCQATYEDIDQILKNVRDSVARINGAVNTPEQRDRINKTVLLQTMLEFHELSPVRDIYRELGPMKLCGVLFVAYQTPTAIQGEYLVCVLFTGYLLLARIDKDYRKLQAVMCIRVRDLRFDELATGRGICCRGAVFSWKMTFGNDKNDSEFILSASSATEEKQWKTEIMKAFAEAEKAGQTMPPVSENYCFSFLNLAILEHLSECTSSLARKASTHTFAASRLSPGLQEVYIKKTNNPNSTEDIGSIAENEQVGRTDFGQIGRAKSVHSKRGPIVLAPRRQDRVRLEKFVVNVYTRDVLPYPGMVITKGGEIMSLTSSLIKRRFSFHKGFNKLSGSSSPAYAGSLMTDNGSIEEQKEEVLDLAKHATQWQTEKDATTEDVRVTVGRSKTLRLKNLCKRTTGSDVPTQYVHNGGDLIAAPRNKRSLLRSALVPKSRRSDSRPAEAERIINAV